MGWNVHRLKLIHVCTTYAERQEDKNPDHALQLDKVYLFN